MWGYVVAAHAKPIQQQQLFGSSSRFRAKQDNTGNTSSGESASDKCTGCGSKNSMHNFSRKQTLHYGSMLEAKVQ